MSGPERPPADASADAGLAALQELIAWPLPPGRTSGTIGALQLEAVPTGAAYPRFYCTVWVKTSPQTHRHWTYRLKHPASGSAREPTGLRYRLLAADGTPLRTAFCAVPRGTEAEVRAALRFPGSAREVSAESAVSGSSCQGAGSACYAEQLPNKPSVADSLPAGAASKPGSVASARVQAYLHSGTIAPADAAVLTNTCGGGGGSEGGDDLIPPPSPGYTPPSPIYLPPPPPPSGGGGDGGDEGLDPSENPDEPCTDDNCLAGWTPPVVVLNSCGGGGNECELQALPESGSECPSPDPSMLPPSPGELDGMPTPPLPSSKPSGITQDAWNDIQQQWNTLNPTEKKLCLFSPAHCGVAAGEAFLAIDFADGLYPTTLRRNGPNDALKHARWAAGMTRSMNVIHTSTGASWAAAWLAAHENVPNNPQAEYDMDMHNNAVGIGIGQSAILDVSQKVEDAWRNGELQEWACPDHPTDRRMGCIPPALR